MGFLQISKKKRLMALSLSFIFGTVGALFAFENKAKLDENSSIRLPCYWPSDPNAASKKYLLTCDQLLFGARLKEQANQGPGTYPVITALTQYFIQYAGLPQATAPTGTSTQRVLRGLYDGVESDPYCSQSASVGTVCDLGYQTQNKGTSPELLSNWKGQSCGATAKITVSLDCVGGKAETQIDLKSPAFTLENSYLLGARIQALKCHAAEVIGRLTQPGNTALVLTDPTARQMAADFNSQVLDGFKNLYTSAGRNLGDPLECDWNNTEIQADKFGTRSSTNPNLHLCALRALMTDAFSRVVAYEIFSKMQTSYTSGFLSPQRQADWVKKLTADIGSACEAQCKNEVTTCDSGKATQCAQKCYNDKIAGEMQKEFNRLWPLPSYANEAAACSDQNGIGMTAGGTSSDPAKTTCWPIVPAGGAQCQ